MQSQASDDNTRNESCGHIKGHYLRNKERCEFERRHVFHPLSPNIIAVVQWNLPGALFLRFFIIAHLRLFQFPVLLLRKLAAIDSFLRSFKFSDIYVSVFSSSAMLLEIVELNGRRTSVKICRFRSRFKYSFFRKIETLSIRNLIFWRIFNCQY